MVSFTRNWHCEHLLVIKPLLQIKKVTFGVIVFGNVSIEIAHFASLLDPNTILGCANEGTDSSATNYSILSTMHVIVNV